MKILPPDKCPSCSGTLAWEKDQLFCKSSTCGDKLYKKVEHFAKTLKIKGLGPATIQKLDIKHISEIYELEKDAMVSVLGEKVTDKLLAEIERSKASSLNEVLPALGFPLIGRSASDKLCNTVSHLTEINSTTCKEAGLGPKATKNLMEGLCEKWLLMLPFSYESEKRPIESNSSKKGVVCISGRLTSYKTKALATKALEDNGFVVKPSLTKEVTILINERCIESAKTKKAREQGVIINTNIKELLKEI